MHSDLEQTIRERAYQIWEREGRIHGRDQEHWHSARLELAQPLEEKAAIAVKASKSAAPAKKAGAKSKAEVTVPAATAAKGSRRTPSRTVQ